MQIFLYALKVMKKKKIKKFYWFLQLLLYCENMKVMWHRCEKNVNIVLTKYSYP